MLPITKYSFFYLFATFNYVLCIPYVIILTYNQFSGTILENLIIFSIYTGRCGVDTCRSQSTLYDSLKNPFFKFLLRPTVRLQILGLLIHIYEGQESENYFEKPSAIIVFSQWKENESPLLRCLTIIITIKRSIK